MGSFVPFILFYWIAASDVRTANFGSERACNIALQTLQAQHDKRFPINGFCVAVSQ